MKAIDLKAGDKIKFSGKDFIVLKVIESSKGIKIYCDNDFFIYTENRNQKFKINE